MRDVTGFSLRDAVDILKAAGITEIEVKLAVPPRKIGEEYNHNSRVVRQKTAVGTLKQELVVCNFESPSLMKRFFSCF